MTSPADFAADTAVEPLGGGRYRGRAPQAWFGPIAPNGGFLAAVVLRAMTAELGASDREPRSLTVHFLRPPSPGEIDVELRVERSGRTASTVSARVEQEGRLMALVVCTFTARYDGAAEWTPRAPDAPPPAGAAPLEPSDRMPPMFHQLDVRPLFGTRRDGNDAEALVGGWVRPRFPHPLDHALLAFLADAWWPAAFARLRSFAPVPTLDLTVHFRGVPPAGAEFVLGRFETRAAIAGVVEEDGELWSEDGRLLAQSRQLALLG